MGRIDSLFGANRLTFRGEQVSGAKRPGANRSSGRNDPDSSKPSRHSPRDYKLFFRNIVCFFSNALYLFVCCLYINALQAAQYDCNKSVYEATKLSTLVKATVHKQVVRVTGTRIPDPLFPHLVPPAIMVWIFVWKYIFEPFIHILQHFVLQLSRSTNFCF